MLVQIVDVQEWRMAKATNLSSLLSWRLLSRSSPFIHSALRTGRIYLMMSSPNWNISAIPDLREGNSPVNSPHKGHRPGSLMISMIYAWTNGWVNNGDGGALKRYCTHCDVNVMWKMRYAAIISQCEFCGLSKASNAQAHILLQKNRSVSLFKSLAKYKRDKHLGGRYLHRGRFSLPLCNVKWTYDYFKSILK